MKSTVTIYKQPWKSSSTFDQENWFRNREDWFQHRESGFSYVSELDGEQAAEEAFHITNAPEECLTEEQRELLKVVNFKGPAGCVGDIFRVEPYIRHTTQVAGADYYLCKSIGWEKFEGNIIELLKHLSW